MKLFISEAFTSLSARKTALYNRIEAHKHHTQGSALRKGHTDPDLTENYWHKIDHLLNRVKGAKTDKKLKGYEEAYKRLYRGRKQLLTKLK